MLRVQLPLRLVLLLRTWGLISSFHFIMDQIGSLYRLDSPIDSLALMFILINARYDELIIQPFGELIRYTALGVKWVPRPTDFFILLQCIETLKYTWK